MASMLSSLFAQRQAQRHRYHATESNRCG
ncbi:rCG58336 [Rattus norvegicus]|uniref:RCG58336 n=1 Tax=Rattus norvegicus TaxID=10116 RepID=A6J3S1_RAT|nr:rCG58336 [Rattus norvegicus]